VLDTTKSKHECSVALALAVAVVWHASSATRRVCFRLALPVAVAAAATADGTAEDVDAATLAAVTGVGPPLCAAPRWLLLRPEAPFVAAALQRCRV
jgi:hypothetical protein